MRRSVAANCRSTRTAAQAVLPVHPELVIVLPPIHSRLHQFFDVSAVCDEVCEVMWVILCVDCQEVIPCSAPFGLYERAFALWCEVECWRAVIDEGHGVSRCVACVLCDVMSLKSMYL